MKLKNNNNIRATTIRFTPKDLAVLKRLEEITGLQVAQVVRVALRNLLERLEKR